MTDNKIILAPDGAQNQMPPRDCWDILIVDDDKSVHDITRLALAGCDVLGKGLNLLYAFSAKEAIEILSENDQIALILLDVVMETDQAGLDAIKIIREDLKRDDVRIVLRTGQPGHVPELDTIANYDINDYKSKAELTRSSLLTSVIAAIRSWVQIKGLQKAEEQLEEFNAELESLVDKRTEELNQARKVAEQALEARSQFLANVSHEIRTPMSGILGMVELLKTAQLKDQDREYLDIIEHSGNTLLTVINDILDYSKLDAGKLTLEKRSVDLSDFLNQTMTPYRVVNNSEQVDIELQLAPQLQGKCFMTDSVRLHQILSNLMNNACKFTEEGFVRLGVDGIALKHNRYRLDFSVTDSGIGIPAEKQKDIFKPFTQSDQSTARQYGGTGLGLSICSQILTLMESELAIESTVGKGSCFSFGVELEQAEKPNAQKPLPVGTADTELLNVLLVEDNPVNQLVCSKLLERFGAEVDIAGNGEEAVQKITEEEACYDIILMDCQMPVMDGFEATRNIRNWESLNDHHPVKIVALTAHTLPEHIEQCIAAGMDEHLSKPVNIEHLSALLSKARVQGE